MGCERQCRRVKAVQMTPLEGLQLTLPNRIKLSNTCWKVRAFSELRFVPDWSLLRLFVPLRTQPESRGDLCG